MQAASFKTRLTHGFQSLDQLVLAKPGRMGAQHLQQMLLEGAAFHVFRLGGWLSVDLDKLNIKNQRFIGADGGTLASFAISEG